jgi:hypothetical protein
MNTRKRVYLTPSELSFKAFEIYSNSDFVISSDYDGYYVDDNYIGKIEDLDEYLSEIYDFAKED